MVPKVFLLPGIIANRLVVLFGIMETLFQDIQLNENDYFRAIVLYGRNVASYKFALADSLFNVASQGKDFATLEELAVPFSDALCRHLELQDKQSTRANPGHFLDTLKSFNKGDIDAEQKNEVTVRNGFTYVIDAFHVVGKGDVPVRFFHDERQSSTPGIRLTDELLNMALNVEGKDLIEENESRWRLVETAWAYNVPQRLLTVNYDEQLASFYAVDSSERRQSVTGAAPALNGYQRGKCFYCNRQIHLGDWQLLTERGEVDHFFPHVLQRSGDIEIDLDQAWNLVLACNQCNGASEKRDLCPDISYVEDLHRRNEKLIESHDPLKESIIARTGRTEIDRRRFLQSCYNTAKTSLIHTWKTLRAT